MKQMLKDIITVWIAIILVLASIFILIEVPYLIFAYAGVGEWQLVVVILWITFWLSFTIAVAKRL